MASASPRGAGHRRPGTSLPPCASIASGACNQYVQSLSYLHQKKKKNMCWEAFPYTDFGGPLSLEVRQGSRWLRRPPAALGSTEEGIWVESHVCSLLCLH